jgi:hypothetical protein
MIDFRYHALSLAAVLLALAVGVLIGVAIGDSNLVSSAKSGIVRELRAEVSSAQAGASKLEEGLAQERALSGDLYPLAVHGLLAGRAIGLVFLGGPSEADDDLAREAITRAGGELTAVVAVREPLELTAIAAHASGTRYAQLARGRLVGAFGRRMGAQLVQGGRLLARVQTPLLSSFDGQPGHLDGVVVARAQPAGLTHARAAAAEFETGLLDD